MTGRAGGAARPGREHPLGARALLAIAAAALLPRLAAVALLRHGAILADALTYHEQGARLAQGLSYGDPIRAPLYPYLISFVYRAAGVHATAVYVAQAFAETAVIALLAYAVSRRLGRRAGLAAGLLAALYPARIVYSALLLSENPSVFLLALVATCLLALEERPRWALALGAGAASGLAFLARPVLVLTVAAPLATIALLRIEPERRRRLQAAALGGFLAAVLPWVVTASVRSGRVIFGDVRTGYNLWVGNNPEFRGRPDALPAIATLDFTDPYAENARLRSLAVRYALAHPFRTVALWVPKTSYWWSPEHRDVMYLYSNGWLPEVAPGLLWAAYAWMGAGFVVLVPFALRGAFSGPTPALAGCLAGVLAVWGMHLVSFADSRYHLPALPFLWVLAGAGAARRGALPSRRRAACAALTLLFLGNAAYDLATTTSTVRRLAAPGGNQTRINYDIWR